ncbi:MAG: hypothetical protein V3T83_20810 [Acidobacteriota bacterium]
MLTALFGVVDPHEAVVLHEDVPDIPGRYKNEQSVKVPAMKPHRRGKEYRRRQKETQPEALEEFTIPIGPKKSWEMMSEGEESQQKNSDLLRGEEAAGGQKDRDANQGSANKDQAVRYWGDDPAAAGPRIFSMPGTPTHRLALSLSDDRLLYRQADRLATAFMGPAGYDTRLWS